MAKKNTIYYDNGKIKEENYSDKYEEVGEKGKSVVFEYDKEGNKNSEITQLKLGENIKKTWIYEYPKTDKNVLYKVTETMLVKKSDLGTEESDVLGDTTIKKVQEFNLNGKVSSESIFEDNVLGKKQAYKYDDFNNVIERKLYEGKDLVLKSTESKSFNKDNKIEWELDDKGMQTDYSYDLRLNLIAKSHYDDINYYGYDRASRLIWESSELENSVALQDLRESYNGIKGTEKYKEIFDFNSDGIIDLFDIVQLVSGNLKLNKTNLYYDNANNVIAKEKEYADKNTNKIVKELISGYKFDSEGRVLKEVDGEALSNVEGKLIKDKVNNAYGTEYVYDYQREILSQKRPADAIATKYSYDNAVATISDKNIGRIKIETKEKGSFRTTNDIYGNILTKEIVENGEIKLIEGNTYDYIGNIIAKRDAKANIYKYEYNSLGRIRSKTLPGDSDSPELTIKYRYNPYGEEVFSKDSFSKKITTSRDYKGRVLSETVGSLKSITAADEVVNIKKPYSYTINENGSTTVTEIDGNKNTIIKVYDSFDRLIKQTSLVTSGVEKKELVTETSYLANNLVSETIDVYGNVYTNKYDVYGKLIEKRDGYGNIIEKLNYYLNGNQKTSIDALNNTKTFKYDKNNRLIETIDGEGKSITQSYDSEDNIILKVDSLKNESVYVYDLRSRLKSVEFKGDSASITRYNYDENNNLIEVLDGENRIKRYEYTSKNELRTSSDVSGDIIYSDRMNYYPNGSIKSKIDKNGNEIKYRVDGIGREIEVKTALKDTPNVIADKVITKYDNNNNKIRVSNQRNNIIIDTIDRVYDETNRVISKSSMGKDKNDIKTTLYGYDGTTGLDSGYHYETISFDGKVTKNIFDRAGRIVKSNANGNNTNIDYYPNGNKKSVEYENSKVSEEYVYNKNNSLTNLKNKKDGEIISEYNYTYNDNNQLGVKEDNKGKTIYTYDSVNRLKIVDEPNKDTTYTYDKAGNRKQELIKINGVESKTIYEYNGFNRLTNTRTTEGLEVVGSKVYTYDNNGNVKSEIINNKSKVLPKDSLDNELKLRENINNSITNEKMANLKALTTVEQRTVNYQYDLFNNMIIAKDAANKDILTNQYNGENLRIRKTTKDEDTKFIYEGQNPIVELNIKAPQAKSTVSASNQYVGNTLLSRTVGTTNYNYLYNGHGDVVNLIDNKGTIKNTYYYDAFGVIEESTETINNPFKYSKYEYDKETSKYYLKSRMYDPETARFMQQDTYTGESNDPLSLNLYTYCSNEPMMYYDPDGHIGVLAVVLIAAGIGALVGAGSNLAFDYMDDKQINSGWRSYAGASLEGAAGGALFPAVGTLGLGAFATGSLLYAGNAVANSIGQYVSTGKISTTQALIAGNSASNSIG